LHLLQLHAGIAIPSDKNEVRSLRSITNVKRRKKVCTSVPLPLSVSPALAASTLACCCHQHVGT
jgi:hypothetical protein